MKKDKDSNKDLSDFYLVCVRGDVEPDIESGPYKSEEEVRAAAIQYRKDHCHGDEDGMYCLEIDKDRKPFISSFSPILDEEETLVEGDECPHCGGTMQREKADKICCDSCNFVARG